METKKIALACFVGGALCATVALLVAPLYWWLGLIVGFAGGYVAYEFREVLKAIPIAWCATVEVISILWRETSNACSDKYNNV
ncbi:MAG: hypothetical protein AAB920_02140, partial [Patescibacteria group bacterium]